MSMDLNILQEEREGMLKLMAPLTVNDDRQKPIHAEDKKKQA